jgi:hypothetical protein
MSDIQLFVTGKAAPINLTPGSVIQVGADDTMSILSLPGYNLIPLVMTPNQEVVLSTTGGPPNDLDRLLTMLQGAAIPSPAYTVETQNSTVFSDWKPLLPNVATVVVPGFAPNVDFGIFGVWSFDVNGVLIGIGHYETIPDAVDSTTNGKPV